MSPKREAVKPKRTIGDYQGISSMHQIKYSNYKNSRIYTNSYFNGEKTFKPLYSYYLPMGFEAESYYYSALYGLKYNDGYGYNFYSGEYGYYEYSVNPSAPTSGADM